MNAPHHTCCVCLLLNGDLYAAESGPYITCMEPCEYHAPMSQERALNDSDSYVFYAPWEQYRKSPEVSTAALIDELLGGD